MVARGLWECSPGTHTISRLPNQNPVGSIPGRSTLLLRWRFLPLEAKEYEYTCTIKYKGGAVGSPVTREETIRVIAFGYDPRVENPHAVSMPGIKTGLVPPPYQILHMPSQVAMLSHAPVANNCEVRGHGPPHLCDLLKHGGPVPCPCSRATH